MTKISLVVGAIFGSGYVDDNHIQHDYCLIIENEKQNYRFFLELNHDEELSKKHLPFWSRTMSLENLINMRDELTKLIKKEKDNARHLQKSK